MQYRTFKDEVRILGVKLDMDYYYHIVFALQTPRSWSMKKKAAMEFTAHQQRPDKDNLEKALLDALFAEDASAWDGRVTKVWSPANAILISKDNIPLDAETLRSLICKS